MTNSNACGLLAVITAPARRSGGQRDGAPDHKPDEPPPSPWRKLAAVAAGSATMCALCVAPTFGTAFWVRNVIATANVAAGDAAFLLCLLLGQFAGSWMERDVYSFWWYVIVGEEL